jgi:hypothetical protein
MRASWYLLKYSSDVFRAEPRNIGVIVVGDEANAVRFAGERDGQFDGRRVKGMVSSPDAFRAWIGYLRHHVEGGTFDRVLQSLKRRAFDNYLVEYRGEILEISGSRDVDRAASDLFSRLVSVPNSPGENLDDKVNRLLFEQVRVPDGNSIEQDVSYSVRLQEGAERLVRFDFRYRNGKTTLLDKVSFAGPDRSVDARVNDLLFRIEHVRSDSLRDFVTLYDEVQLEANDNAERQLRTIEKYSHMVNVNSVDAVQEVSDSLNILALP